MAFRPPWIEQTVLRALDPVTHWLVRSGVHPNTLTTAGFAVTCSAGLSFHWGNVPLAGVLVLFGGAFDIFDGRVARTSGLASVFGSFYDSTLDRISEIVVFLGILSLYNDYRVELGDVGMMQRPERVVLIGVAALFFGTLWEGLVLKAVLIAMAILTNLTAFQRIVWIYRHTRKLPPAPREEP